MTVKDYISTGGLKMMDFKDEQLHKMSPIREVICQMTTHLLENRPESCADCFKQQ